MFAIQKKDPDHKKDPHLDTEQVAPAGETVQASPQGAQAVGAGDQAAPLMSHWADQGVQMKGDADAKVQMKENPADTLINMFQKYWSGDKGLSESEYESLKDYARAHKIGDFDRGRMVAGFNKVTSGGGVLGFLKGTYDRSGAGKGTIIFNCLINGSSYQELMERLELGA